MAKAITREDVESVRERIQDTVLTPILEEADNGKWVRKNWAGYDYGAGAYVENTFLTKAVSSKSQEDLMIAKILCLLTMLESQNNACSNIYANLFSSQDTEDENAKYMLTGVKEFFLSHHDAFSLTAIEAEESLKDKSIDNYLKERMQEPVLDPMNKIVGEWAEKNLSKDSEALDPREFYNLSEQLKPLCSEENLVRPGYLSSSTLGNTLTMFSGILNRAVEIAYNTALVTVCNIAARTIAGSAATKFLLGSAAFAPIGIILSTCGPALASKLVSEEHISSVLKNIADTVIKAAVNYSTEYYKHYMEEKGESADAGIIEEDWEIASHGSSGANDEWQILDHDHTSQPKATPETKPVVALLDTASPADPSAVDRMNVSADTQEADAASTEKSIPVTFGDVKTHVTVAPLDTATPSDLSEVDRMDVSADTQDGNAGGIQEADAASTEKSMPVTFGGNQKSVKFETEEGSNFRHINVGDQVVTFDEVGHLLIDGQKVLFQEGLNIKLIFSDGFYDVVTAFGSTKLRPVIVKTPPSSPAKDSTGSNQIQTYEETNDDVPIMGET